MDKFSSTSGADVSVVIPCYQQGHFLSEAIESVLAQTLPAHEIVVVDDGSTDNTAAVAAMYAGVRYIHQNNSGSSAARNRGLNESTGRYLIFLDADDRLLKDALETGVSSLNAQPECAFVFGRCQYIEHDGSPVSVFQAPYHESDDYLAMLRICPIWHPAAVMCRRSVVELLEGFDVSLSECTDYDFYLRVTKRWPIHCHNQLISEYRQHLAAKSANNSRMLRSTTRILSSQVPLFEGNRQYEEAYRDGMRNFRSYYYHSSIRHLRAFLDTGNHQTQVLRNVLLVIRIGPRMLAGSAGKRMRGFVRRMGIRFLERPLKNERPS